MNINDIVISHLMEVSEDEMIYLCKRCFEIGLNNGNLRQVAEEIYEFKKEIEANEKS